MWIYVQSGRLYRGSRRVADCYAGHGEGKNNGLQQHSPGVGPIPCGAWMISEPRDSERTGKFVLPLIPLLGTQTFGRSAFEIHGENAAHPGDSSHGCIVAPPDVRQEIADSGDCLLLVIPELG